VRGVPVLYGEAGNSEILEHAALDRARALVITLPDDATALAVASAARRLAPQVRIISRASTWDGARQLKARDVGDVVRPELEGGIEIVRRTLLNLELPVREVQRYTELIRREGLDESERPSLAQARVLEDLLTVAGDLEISWIVVAPDSRIAGRTLAQSALRESAGVSVIAIARADQLVTNPGPREVLAPGDRAAIIGSPAQIAVAEAMFAEPAVVSG